MMGNPFNFDDDERGDMAHLSAASNTLTFGNVSWGDFGTSWEMQIGGTTELTEVSCECERKSTMALWKVYWLLREDLTSGEALIVAKSEEAARFQMLIQLGATDYDAYQLQTELIMEIEEDE